MRVAVGILVPLMAILVVGLAPLTTAATGVTPSPPSTPPAGTLLTDAVPLPTGEPLRELPSSTPVSLTLTLSNPHAAQLREFLVQVEDPRSPAFRHFVSYPEFVRQFAPPSSSVAVVESFLVEAGARSVTSTPDRSAVTAVLPAASVEKMLGVSLVVLGNAHGLPLYTTVGTAALPPSLEGLVAAVGGLSDVATGELLTSSILAHEAAPRPIPLAGATFAYVNTTHQTWFVGSDYTQAFGATQLLPGTGSVPNATYPRSVAVATLLVSAYNQTSGDLPPWDPAVINAYLNSTLAPGWPMPNLTGVPVPINGVTPPLPGSFGGVNDSTPYETENSLDLEMAGSLAPGASIYNFYFAASLLEGSATTGDAANYFAETLALALAHDYGTAHLAAVSCSFGLPDLDSTAWDVELLTAAATGVTIVSASGDQGNAPDSLTGRSDGQWPIWPASAASDLGGSVSVGGVTLGMSGTPSAYYNGTALNLSYDPQAGVIENATAWYDNTGGGGTIAGSEGGVSTTYAEPAWEFRSAAESAIVNATIHQGAGTLGRAVPDVAMPANLTIATTFANSTGAVFFEVLEGTSVAAPVLAGLIADVVAVENNGSPRAWTSLGFIDPEIYRLGSYFATHPGANSNPFSDVTTGSNYVFSAAPGWDPITGWGVVVAPAFLADVQNQTLLTYNYTGPTPGLPSVSSSTGNVPWPVIFVIFGVGIAVAVVLVVWSGRSSRAPPPQVPWGAQGGAPLPPSAAVVQRYPGATFLCPYCGAIRPSEPVRCPQCGAL